MNVQLNDGFKQVCVWPGTIVGADNVADFEQFMLNEVGVRVQYLEEIHTAPDMVNGYPVEGTGGRCDVLFAVHNADVMKFAIPRLQYGMRWLEDALDGHCAQLYPERVADYKCWAEAA